MRVNPLKSTPRYELIFALGHQAADEFSAFAEIHMATDTTSASICDRYYESSNGVKPKSARRQQSRVRRIDNARDVLLESLSWKRDIYSLRQTKVTSSDLINLQSRVIDKSWVGKWFHKKLIKHSLTPSLEIRFDRVTRASMSLDGEIRLTIDRNIRANGLQTQHPAATAVRASKSPAADPTNPAANPTNPTANPTSIVRMNYSVSLPSVFKSMIYEFALLPEHPTVPLELARAQADEQINDVSAPVVFGPNPEVASCQLG